MTGPSSSISTIAVVGERRGKGEEEGRDAPAKLSIINGSTYSSNALAPTTPATPTASSFHLFLSNQSLVFKYVTR